MGKNTSISLGDQFVNFAARILDSERYNNVSEVVRAALSLLLEEEKLHKKHKIKLVTEYY